MPTYFKNILFVFLTPLFSFFSCRKTTGEIPIPQFSYTLTCVGDTCQAQFDNESIGAESSQWFFGDGTSSVERNPRHTYPAGAFYQVTLYAVGRDNEANITETVSLPQN
jgi:PKD repeat protein